MANPCSHEYELQLRAYVTHILSTADDRKALRATGLSASAREISIRRLTENGTLAARPSTGRHPKYTDAVCERALEILEEHDGEQLTLTHLLQLLEAANVVETPTDRSNFSTHLRDYVHAHGRYINTTCDHTIFMLARTDHKPRVDFCTAALELLGTRSLEDVVFIDETAWEEAPHPKGRHRTARRTARKGRGRASSCCCAPVARSHAPWVPLSRSAPHGAPPR